MSQPAGVSEQEADGRQWHSCAEVSSGTDTQRCREHLQELQYVQLECDLCQYIFYFYLNIICMNGLT